MCIREVLGYTSSRNLRCIHPTNNGNSIKWRKAKHHNNPSHNILNNIPDNSLPANPPTSETKPTNMQNTNNLNTR